MSSLRNQGTRGSGLGRFLCGVVALWLLGGVPVGVQADSQGKDEEFGGQILTLTDKPKVEFKSDNPRFKSHEDGTVNDLQEKLVWAQKDSYQTLKKWLNWHDAQKYIEELNARKFGGASNWRLPTRKELASLFDPEQSIPWNYYWTKNELHIDPIFGDAHCCYWSQEEKGETMAWGFNYIRGKPYLSMKGGIQHSLSVIRAVRDNKTSEMAEK